MTPYDSLIVAAGAAQSYFGNDHFAEFAPGMKSIDDALELRGRIFGAFEMAELGATRGDNVDHLLTFVVVGAGPTGVEMAGQIAELAHRTLQARLPRDQHPHGAGDPARRRAAGAAAVRRRSSAPRPRRELEKLGVEVILGAMVTDVDERGIEMKFKDGRTERIDDRHQDLGGRRAGQPARPHPLGADRRAARPRRPDRASTPTSRCPATPRCSWSAT